MLLTTFVALFLVLIVKTSLAAVVIKKPNTFDYSSYYVEATVDIVKSCYSKRVKAIGVIGELPETLLHTLWLQQPIPVVVLSTPTTLVKFDQVNPLHLYKLQVFVVAASTPEKLWKNCRKLRNSIWWNRSASLIILYWSPGPDQNCWQIHDFLIHQLRRGVLNTYVICFYYQLPLMIVTYNPYSREAPDPWQHLSTTVGRRKEQFHLFLRRYKKTDKICENLDFDKTKNLTGHVIRVLVLPVEEEDFSKKRFELNDNDGSNNLLQNIQRALNVTLLHSTALSRYNYGLDGDAAFKFVDCTIADMCINSVDNLQLYSTSYPHFRKGLHIMTQFRGHKTQLEKILFVIDRSSRLGLSLVLLVTVMFFKLVVHQELMSAVLNVVRIICNAGFTNLPERIASRFYLTGILMFTVTMQGIYQGQLASLLTTHVPLPDINTMQELADSDYTIYGFETWIPLFDDPIFEGRFNGLKNPDCAEYVINNSSAACVGIEEVLIDQAMKLKLHLSREPIAMFPVVWVVCEHWPLREKVDMLIMKLQEAAIRRPFEYRTRDKMAKDFVLDEKVKSNAEIKVMTLGELSFAFVILGIGLTCAIITFIVEMAIGTFRRRFTSVSRFSFLKKEIPNRIQIKSKSNPNRIQI